MRMREIIDYDPIEDRLCVRYDIEHNDHKMSCVWRFDETPSDDAIEHLREKTVRELIDRFGERVVSESEPLPIPANLTFLKCRIVEVEVPE